MLRVLFDAWCEGSEQHLHHKDGREEQQQESLMVLLTAEPDRGKDHCRKEQEARQHEVVSPGDIRLQVGNGKGILCQQWFQPVDVVSHQRQADECDTPEEPDDQYGCGLPGADADRPGK